MDSHALRTLTFRRELRELIDANRATCLWFARPGWYPTDALDCVIALRALQKGGNAELFKAAAALLTTVDIHPEVAPSKFEPL